MFYGKIIKQNEVGCKTINVYPCLKVLNDKAEFFADERQFYLCKIVDKIRIQEISVPTFLNQLPPAKAGGNKMTLT